MINVLLYGFVWVALAFSPMVSFAATPKDTVRSKIMEAWSFGDFDEAERWAEKSAKTDGKRLQAIKKQKRRCNFLLDEASKAMEQGYLHRAWKFLEKAEKIKMLKQKLEKSGKDHISFYSLECISYKIVK